MKTNRRKIRRVDGERIYIRPISLADVSGTYVKWMNDPEVNQFLESRFDPHTLETVTDFVRSVLADKNQYMFAIILKDSGRHIGNIKIGSVSLQHGYGEIGILIGEKDCWGKGYGAEAIELVSRFAFEDLKFHKVFAGCYSNNIGSAKAFCRVGFKTAGVLKEHYLSDGKYVDKIVLELIRPAEEDKKVVTLPSSKASGSKPAGTASPRRATR